MTSNKLIKMSAISESNSQSSETLCGNQLIDWLKDRSMLLKADDLNSQFGGYKDQWQNSFGASNHAHVLNGSSVWLSVYANSIIGPSDKTVLDVLGDRALHEELAKVGINAIHTGPLMRSGSLTDGNYGPSIDGHFDRIELEVDPEYGDDGQYQAMVQNARARGISIIGDLIPGHTGKGADFRLAEKNVAGFQGLYAMLEVEAEHWDLLPNVRLGEDSVNLTQMQASQFKELGYCVVAPLNVEVFGRPGIKESCWSATPIVKGVDGVDRRWLYLHIFKEGQPSLDWSHPSFAAYRMQSADILHSVKLLGTEGLRMDATMFLGIEATPDREPSLLAGHPITGRVTDLLAMMVRKLGGFSFQELNVELDRISSSLKSGPEFNYDFPSRPNYLYALATGDGGPLRLILREMLRYGVQPNRMVHGMQNHDELMLEATHFIVHRDKIFEYEGQRIRGDDLYHKIANAVLEKTGEKAVGYNHSFAMSPGVCSTFVAFISAVIGVEKYEDISAPQSEQIKRMHLLVAAFNALQGGIFNISAWDLVGSTTLAANEVEDLLQDNDHRWINRGGYDLLGCEDAHQSILGLPRANALYGGIPEQLRSPTSFVSLLSSLLSLRESLDIANSQLIEIPLVDEQGIVLLLNALPDKSNGGAAGSIQISALNFSDELVTQWVDCPRNGDNAKSLWSNIDGELSQQIECNEGRLKLELEPYEARLILVNE